MIVFFLSIIIVILIITLIVVINKNNSVNQLDMHLASFIELNNYITVITDTKEILAINTVGLNFFHFKSTEAFLKKHKYLSKLFTEIKLEHKDSISSINWVTKIKNRHAIKVEMYDKKLKQIFDMQVNRINEERYLVSFYNVSRLVAEKEAIEEQAVKDELTQIYNRSKFNTVLASELRNAEIYDDSFSIILFDIDHFKQVNDTFGHSVGDKVLIQLSALVKNQLRREDIFARWGGEEFVIISPKVTEKNAYNFASRLCRIIDAFHFDTINHLTCSFGIAGYRKKDTSKIIINRADDALYEAKATGRNKVCI
jgi:diguanylate cyclase (GGDEF)-like protein